MYDGDVYQIQNEFLDLTFIFLLENITSMCLYRHRCSKYRLDFFCSKDRSHADWWKWVPYFEAKSQYKCAIFKLFLTRGHQWTPYRFVQILKSSNKSVAAQFWWGKLLYSFNAIGKYFTNLPWFFFFD